MTAAFCAYVIRVEDISRVRSREMNKDRRIIYICSYTVFFLLLLVLFIPVRYNQILSASVVGLAALSFSLVVKKRAIYGYKWRQLTALMCFIGFLCVSLYILSGLAFGFVKPLYKLSFGTLWRYILPVMVTVVASELLRAILLAQKSRHVDILSYAICVLSEILLAGTAAHISSPYALVDMIAQALLPAAVANLLYTYLSRRYGSMPNIGYRLFISLYSYFIPIASAMPDALRSLARLFIPIIIYLFIDAVYEKKKKNALSGRHIIGYAASAFGMIISVMYVMLISCQFSFGLLVIATPSMSGEINQGDAVIYEEYGGERIDEGAILVFDRNGETVVHRVARVEHINGQTRYITKGDANEDNDPGYITKSNVIGIVEAKLPFVGQPALWLRDIFN